MGGKHTDATTIEAVIDLYQAGHTSKEICDIKKMKLRTVQNLIHRFRAGGESELPLPKKQPGKPKKTSSRTRSVLRRQIEGNPSLTAKELKEQNHVLLCNVSLRTVQETLHRDLDYRCYRPRKKPLINDRQRKRRLLFAKKYRDWPLDNWRKVLWSDESTFCVSGGGPAKVYRRPGSDPTDPRYTQKTTKHPPSLMVWGCFSYYGVGDLVVLPKNTTVNKVVYFELLNDHLEDCFLKTQAQTFQQDGASCHTARDVTQWLDDCGIEWINDWPGNSPDISPIENLWAIIKGKLRSRDISTLPKLEAELKKCWKEFKPVVLQNLADSVPRRLQMVIKKKGYPTKY